jgi:(p)ppGpp synthase/HD superfamily hydrolase
MPYSALPLLSKRFSDAFLFAVSLHDVQTRKKISGSPEQEGNVPYISHLMAVSAMVLEAGGTEDEAIAALLHDTFEDGPHVLARKRNLPRDPLHFEALMHEIRATVRARFGNSVHRIVEECTEDKATVDKRERKKAYLEGMKTASHSAKLVMLCDKIHNAESIVCDLARFGDSVWTKFSLGKESSLLFYTQALQLAWEWENDAQLKPLVRRFERAVLLLQNS